MEMGSTLPCSFVRQYTSNLPTMNRSVPRIRDNALFDACETFHNSEGSPVCMCVRKVWVRIRVKVNEVWVRVRVRVYLLVLLGHTLGH